MNVERRVELGRVDKRSASTERWWMRYAYPPYPLEAQLAPYLTGGQEPEKASSKSVFCPLPSVL
ncbi:MAG: hypothetical protein WC091_07655 [Sulfuricellaceae bacterium]